MKTIFEEEYYELCLTLFKDYKLFVHIKAFFKFDFF